MPKLQAHPFFLGGIIGIPRSGELFSDHITETHQIIQALFKSVDSCCVLCDLMMNQLATPLKQSPMIMTGLE